MGVAHDEVCLHAATHQVLAGSVQEMAITDDAGIGCVPFKRRIDSLLLHQAARSVFDIHDPSSCFQSLIDYFTIYTYWE